ncbi:MAG: tetratricopeptide repeat protein [Planctomycetota bacterium]|nr:tetratricopeptide repeat protein [Planctomycetota bacterium]
MVHHRPSLSRDLVAILCILLLPASTLHAQSLDDLLRERRVTLRADGTLIDEVIGLLIRETGVVIELDDGLGEIELSGEVENLPLGEALDLLLASAGLEYEIRENRVVIRRSPDAPERPVPEVEPEAPPPEVSLDVLIRGGEYAEAERRIRTGLEEAPGDLSAILLLVRVLNETGRYGKAIQTLTETLEAHPDELDLRLELGRLYLRTGKYPEAEKHLKACGERPVARWSLGHLYLDLLGKREKGREILEELMLSGGRRKDLTSEALEAAGQANEALGYFDEATTLYRRAGETDPDRAEPYRRWALVFLHKHDQRSAVELAEKALEVHPASAEAIVVLARCILANQRLGIARYARAIAEVHRALEINPNLPEAHLFLVDMEIFDGETTEAVEHIERTLEVNPRSIPALARLAAIHLLVEEFEEANAIETEVLAGNPKAYRFYLYIAEVIDSRFRYRGAAELARKAIELEPESGEAHFVLGSNLLRIGEMEEGEKAIRAAQVFDTNPVVRNTLRLLEELEENYETFESDHFVIRIHKKEAGVLLPYVRRVLEQARESLGERYGFYPKGRVICEVYRDHNSFSARIVGFPWIGAFGVCFGEVLAIDSPTAWKAPEGGRRQADEEDEAVFSWARTLWHEYTHTVTLLSTRNRIPRWMTEGLSVLEEGRARPEWSREGEMSPTFFTALTQGRLLGIGELNRGFTKPEFGGQVLLSYYQGSMVCRYIEERFGLDALKGIMEGYSRSLGTAEVFSEVLGMDLNTFDREFQKYCLELMESTGFRPLYSVEQLARLKESLKESPDDPRRVADVARAYSDVGKLAEAQIFAARAVELEPDLGDAQAIMGRTLLLGGSGEAAEVALLRALDLGCKDELRVHSDLADIYRKSKVREKEFEHLLAAQQLLPMDSSISRGLAKIKQEAGGIVAAIPHLEAAALSDPSDLKSRVTLMQAYLEQGKTEDLARIGSQIVAIEPFSADLHYVLGQSYRELGRMDDALLEYDVALVMGHYEEEQILCTQAEIYLDAGENDRAREKAERALKINPNQERAKRVLEGLESRGARRGDP